MSKHTELFDQAYALIREKVKDITDWSAVDVMMFAVLGMEIVETYPTLSGTDKRDLVVQLARKVVEEIDISEQERREWQMAIDVLLPAAIDQIVAAANGQLKLGSGGKKSRGCFSCAGRRKKNKKN